MPRSFKTMFVELVSFLTLFTLVGTMSSNFWERYLIQTELSNMKSSLHVLKETLFNIGKAYDTLNCELKSLAEMRDINKPQSDRRYSDSVNVFSTKVLEELRKLKANKSIGSTASKGIDSVPPYKGLNSGLQDATTITRYPQKSTGINSEEEKKDPHNILKDNDDSTFKGSVPSKIQYM